MSALSFDISGAWALPGAALHLGLDALSACFLGLIAVVCGCAGVFGEGYLAASHGHLPARPVRFFFALLAASMAALVLARNSVLFLVSWEVMALSAFFLVSAEHEKPESRRAALLYLLCTHTGSLCLLALFALLGRRAGSLEFSAFSAAALTPLERQAALILAFIGFGMKAGVVPLHIWLQEAHPAAPSHASAAMSGVMIEMGLYGLMRFFSLLGPIPRVWGVFFVIAGIATAVFGVLFALVQSDLKRLLAYSSIENVGIILLGLGLGYAGLASGSQRLALLGFAGAILHTLNHGIFKSLLFLSAGSVYQALGSRDLAAGGGLQKSMPWTGLFSWIGAASICGLPPFNGFIGEWLIYSRLLRPDQGSDIRLTALTASLLALVGALSVAAFTKACGTLFLGQPRTEKARGARDPGPWMLAPMGLLAFLCAAIGLFPAPALRAVLSAAAVCAGADGGAAQSAREEWLPLLSTAAAAAGLFWVLCGLLWILRRALAGREPQAAGPTWGCGFTAPTVRMQYSASSYPAPAARTFSALLGTEETLHAPSGYWPRAASFSSATPDPILERGLPPLAERVSGWLAVGRRLQHGRLQAYLFYVSACLIGILLWKL